MHKKAMDLAKWAMEKTLSCGLDSISSQDWEDLKNCMEAAKAAVCIDKDYKIVEAMEDAEKAAPIVPIAAGYNNRRYASGRYAPAGHGTYVGYTPYLMEDEDFAHNRMGYHPMPYMTGYDDGMYGYDKENMIGMNGYNSRLGTSYARYNDMRRHYTGTNNPEHKKKMNDAASMVMNDMLDIMQDVWADLDENEKAKHNQKIMEVAKKY